MLLCFFNKSCEMAILLRSSETQRFLTVVHPTPPAGKKPTNFNWFVWINCIMWGRINQNKWKAHGAEAEQRDWSMSPRRGNRARHHCPDHQPQTRPATNAHARSLASRTWAAPKPRPRGFRLSFSSPTAPRRIGRMQHVWPAQESPAAPERSPGESERHDELVGCCSPGPAPPPPRSSLRARWL